MANLGSPLRMRGKVTEKKTGKRRRRITPAYAGKSLCVYYNFRVHGDHPCVCGEKKQAVFIGFVIVGSPLRMRGKGRKLRKCVAFNRITPAYAGKRRYRRKVNGNEQDHPCVCGEKFRKNSFASCPLGSPLRMRGKARV